MNPKSVPEGAVTPPPAKAGPKKAVALKAMPGASEVRATSACVWCGKVFTHCALPRRLRRLLARPACARRAAKSEA